MRVSGGLLVRVGVIVGGGKQAKDYGMTVSELIEQLKQMPPDMEVMIFDTDYDFEPIRNVRVVADRFGYGTQRFVGIDQ